MADLIERQQAVEAFETAAKSGASIKDITLILENLPSAKQEAPDMNVGNMDAISRMQAIDELHGKDPSQIWDTADIEVWLNTLPSIQPEQQWIPIEERLPEPWDLVLVTDSCKNVTVCQRGLNLSDGWYDECENWMYFSTSVIAWMPLPKYYQEGKQDE